MSYHAHLFYFTASITSIFPRINNVSTHPHDSTLLTVAARHSIPSPSGRGEKYDGDATIS